MCIVLFSIMKTSLIYICAEVNISHFICVYSPSSLFLTIQHTDITDNNSQKHQKQLVLCQTSFYVYKEGDGRLRTINTPYTTL